MNSAPLVSVIIPAYNQAHYLGEAIRSALSQTNPHLEVLVIDDGSTDATAQVAAQFRDERVQYFFQNNAGLPAARNHGLREAQGEWITFLDSDDQFLPEKLALLGQELERDPALGFVAGQAQLMDQHGQRIDRPFETRLSSQPADLLLGNPFHVGSVLLRRQWFEQVGFFEESLRSYEDWDYWLRLALAGCPMRVIDQPVSLYRFHTAQMTRNGAQMTNATLAVLSRTFQRADLPETWQERKGAAYANAYLRAAAQAYLHAEFDSGKAYLRAALQQNPALSAENALALQQRFSGWTELPKALPPAQFLENIYLNLPDELNGLAQLRGQVLGAAFFNQALDHHRDGEASQALASLAHSARYAPRRLFNRGAASILLHNSLGPPANQKPHPNRTESMPAYYFGPQVHPYVILFIERDGSTYLTSLLSSHPQIEAIYERFAVLKQKGAGAQEQLAWAREFFSPRLLNRVKALGFKTKLVDVLDLEGFAALLQEKQVRVIQMQRRNRVKAVISRINARRLFEQSGHWNLYQEADRLGAEAVDPQLFAQFLREREEADAELDAFAERLQLPKLKIVYEDLLVERDQTLEKVFKFLKIANYPVQARTMKNTSDDLREAILNFDELRDSDSGSRYAHQFDEVLTR